MSYPGNSPPLARNYYQGETSGVRPENSSLDALIQSFKEKIGEFEGKSEIPYTRPTIVSRNNILTESVQSYQKPRLLSVGPLHRGDVNLQHMEDFKWSFVCIILPSIGSSSDEKLSDCFVKLKELEEKSRRTYSVFIDMKSDDFVQMLFLDACFIILLTLAELEGNPPKPTKPLKPDPEPDSKPNPPNPNPVKPVQSANAVNQRKDDSKERTSLSEEQNALLQHTKIKVILTKLQSLNVRELNEDVRRDMIILENQIPFFILEHMWKWFLETLEIESQLDFIGCHYSVRRERFNHTEKIHHYLHLYHCSFAPPASTSKLYDRYNRPWIPSATELKVSGIRFMLERCSDLNADIKFTADGVVHLPEKKLGEDLRAIIQNLVDFEQSVRGGHSTYYSNYVWIMSRLLSTEDDVRILGKRISLRYQKGWDKDVRRFFNDLERRCSYWKGGDEIQTMCNEIDAYTSSRRREWWMTLQRKLCFSDKWYTFTVYGSIVLFILTFLQTFYAMYSYSHPPS